MTFTVDQIEVGKPDSTGQIIEEIYIKIAGLYAIYRAGSRICLHYADDEETGIKQRMSMVNITVMRGTVESLIDEVDDTNDRYRLRRVHRYRRRLADTLQLALQGQSNLARGELEALRERLLAELRSQSSQVYLATAFLTGVVVLLLIAILSKLIGSPVPAYSVQLASMWFAAAVGTVGAVFSTAFTVQKRAIQPSVSLRDTFVDAAIRVLVGSLAGALTYAAVEAKIIGLTIGDIEVRRGDLAFSIVGEDWLRLLLVAFIAGLSERQVPDLLNRMNGDKGLPPDPRLTPRDLLEDAKSSEKEPAGESQTGQSSANDKGSDSSDGAAR